MKVFIQPENDIEQAFVLSHELVISTASGDQYRLIKAVSQKRNVSWLTFRAIPFFMDQPIRQEQLLHQLQQAVEATLAEHKVFIHALYKEVAQNDVSYYILLKDNTFDRKQLILSQLYDSSIDDLRRHTRPVYYHFFPTEQEALLADFELIKL